MNNKGFTLIELLAVMLILISISLVAVGGISASLERRDIKDCEEQQELAVDAAKIYFSLHIGTKQVDIETLKNGKYFSSDKKINRLNLGDVITISENSYLYNGKGIGTSCN